MLVSMNEVIESIGYLTGMAVLLINLVTIITAALATSAIVPAISHAHKRDQEAEDHRRKLNIYNCTIYSAIICTR